MVRALLPFFDKDHSSLRSRARAWVDAHLLTAGVSGDVEEIARQLVQQLGKEEFLRFTVPGEFGGKHARVEARNLCILREELARGSALADTMFALQALGSYPVTLAGSDEQKRRYLPRIANRKQDRT